MLYFKVIDGGNFVGTATSFDLCKYQERNNANPLMLSCSIDEAQYIVSDNNYYHADWLHPETVKGLYSTVDIIEIEKSEFDVLSTNINSEEKSDTDIEEIENINTEDESTVDSNSSVTIEYVKNKKITEMNNSCLNAISKGFDVILSDGETHHFSLTAQDQLNLTTLSALIANGETEIPEFCKFYSVEDITTIINTATAYKAYHVSYFNSLKSYIESMDDIYSISSIEYEKGIPLES